MKTESKLGICMDHSTAHLMEFANGSIKTIVIKTKFTHDVKEQSLRKSENLMHNKEQHEQAEYYKELGNVIKKYTEVILFGPTEAKTELLNTLRANNAFEKIIITVKQSDKMTENQQNAFVKQYFTKHK